LPSCRHILPGAYRARHFHSHLSFPFFSFLRWHIACNVTGLCRSSSWRRNFALEITPEKGKKMDNDEIISTLNDLIETCKDGEAGFRTCAEDISNPQLKSFFNDRAQACATAASELQQEVRALNGTPEKSSSISGTLHRRWVDIKGAITGKDELAILNECERGEDVAKASYSNALTKGLPEGIRVLVEKQYQGVLRNHDQVKQLREQIRAGKA
jgi:uncharacterized protein (TIGR02284 family)